MARCLGILGYGRVINIVDAPVSRAPLPFALLGDNGSGLTRGWSGRSVAKTGRKMERFRPTCRPYGAGRAQAGKAVERDDREDDTERVSLGG